MPDVTFTIEEPTFNIDLYANPELFGQFRLYDEVTLAIASGVITATAPVIKAQAETGTTDAITDITTQVGILFLRADAGDTLTLTDNGSDAANKIRTRDGSAFTLVENAWVALYRKTTSDVWRFWGDGGGSVDTSTFLLVDGSRAADSIDTAELIINTLAAADTTRILLINTLGETITSEFLKFDTSTKTLSGMTTIQLAQILLSGTALQLQSTGGVQSTLRFLENDANGVNYFELKAAASMAGNTSYTLPDAFPTANGHIISSTTGGVMSWVEGDKDIKFTISSTTSTPIPAGNYQIRFGARAGTITAWYLGTDTSATAVLDIWKANASIPTNSNSITASAKPQVSAGRYAYSSTLTGWTTSIADQDVLIIEVESNDNATSITLHLKVI